MHRHAPVERYSRTTKRGRTSESRVPTLRRGQWGDPNMWRHEPLKLCVNLEAVWNGQQRNKTWRGDSEAQCLSQVPASLMSLWRWNLKLRATKVAWTWRPRSQREEKHPEADIWHHLSSQALGLRDAETQQKAVVKTRKGLLKACWTQRTTGDPEGKYLDWSTETKKDGILRNVRGHSERDNRFIMIQ